MDRRLSIEAFKGRRWAESGADATQVIRAVHGAREVPVRDLSLEQLRLQLVQRVGLPWVIDEALIRLDDDPLAEGDLYPGDVLAALTGLDGHAWSSWARPSSRRRRAGRPRRSRGREAPMTRRPGATMRGRPHDGYPCLVGPVAQGIEHRSPKAGVVGSNPTGVASQSRPAR